ncbi:MAG: DnaD domain protein [Oscillospiraceae bacterium]|nr:DnaD domain protein [Oscillospiraceae bacterium]
MPEQFLRPGEIVALSTSAVTRLVDGDNGDAALLYLNMLSGRTQTALAKWTPQRLDSAYAALYAMQLLDKIQPEKPAAPAETVIPETPPEYSTADINRELAAPDSDFPGLAAEVQKSLGKILSTADLKTLYTLYDYLALPPEVIFLLVNWCIEEYERKYGVGRRPRLSTISRHGFFWKNRQIDTVEAAEEFLSRKAQLRSREAALLAELNIKGRNATEKERGFLESWVEMGFPDESIRLAYERTLFQKQNMNWNYMNSILLRWHRQNLHAPEEIEKGDTKPGYYRAKKPLAQDTRGAQPGTTRAHEDVEWLRAYMKRQHEQEGEG